ncbi:hypothetical protein SAMN04488564_12555 [Lentzea waywayandensis]|uniref:Uncharacterized protein n=1 Tax=Lentzea waywayandensis TaxID=84724 RepID=A0A1I6FJ80_9PSEU|nr:hypothetical protein [Lentzea waywayandensis]SFR30003.1 hypothetical protein SAMN04488564_12555 [Lentzea waywayandensis]
MTHDEGDDDSSSKPAEQDQADDAEEQEAPEHPPGHPSWLRILSETNSAQCTPLEEGAERVRGIDPTHWSGAARDGYTARRDELVVQWLAVLDVHGGVSRQIDGYNTFLHELPHLWETYRSNPEELRRLNALHDAAAERLARALEAEAAKLDGLAREPASREEPHAARPSEPEADPEPKSAPDQDRGATRDPIPDVRSDADPDSGADADQDSDPNLDSDSGPDPQSDPEPHQSDSTTTNSGEEARHEPRSDPITVLRERIREHELVNELLQSGRRVERFLWKRPTS